MIRERVQCPGSGQLKRPGRLLKGDVVRRVVDHVFTNALLAVTVEPDQSGLAQEVTTEVELEPDELVALDPERKIGDEVVG